MLAIALACFRADPARSMLSLGLRLAGALGAPLFAYALSSLVATARPGVSAWRAVFAVGYVGAIAFVAFQVTNGRLEGVISSWPSSSPARC